MEATRDIHIKGLTIEQHFMKLLIVFGLLFVFIVPPFQMADEDSHFKKAYLVSQFSFLPNNVDGVIGNYIPNEILEFEASHRYMINAIDEKYSYSRLSTYFSLFTDYIEKSHVEYSTAKTNPILYIPQAGAMLFVNSLMKFLGMRDFQSISPLMYMYAGRIGNLFFYIICIYSSIRLIPVYKRLLFFLSIMPMSVGLATSLSYDSMVIGLCFLTFSLIMYYRYNKDHTFFGKKEIIIFSLISILLIELKQVYFPLLLLIFIIPTIKFGTLKKKITSVSIIFTSGLLGHIFWLLVSKSTTAAPGGEAYIKEQLIFIINNPFKYVEVLIRTISQLKFYYLDSFIGNLGWLDTNFPPIFILIYILLLLLFSFVDTNNQVVITWKMKFYCLSLFILIFLLVETSLYLIWTSIPKIGGIGFEIVSGVQGRYFIPFSILGFILLYSNQFVNEWKKRARDMLDVVTLPIAYFTTTFMLFILIFRYWVP
ncbi:DUF2142 domain-containing protein [Paenibacillus sp. JNUCC32]|uniref:DUF2142 domain-containing protein n=1 Tax=Paenibacillus sp. JNUCC32 TaxID=2777984 RepID=UPI0017886628|nr:DUF2142 domain-containing protein [Paenibacillus sp. JNUCC-32]QOT09874.1 DUF2142 domain-containing protein [Paenibacillus sp. JNUCC-32]